MRLYYAAQNDPAAAIIRANPDMMPGTVTGGMAWLTDTGYKGFLALYAEIDQHLVIDSAGRPAFRSFADAGLLRHKCIAAADLILGQYESLCGVPAEPPMLFPDVEVHQIGRWPYCEDPRDKMLARLLGGQIASRGLQRWGVRPLWGNYHTVRSASQIDARPHLSEQWGTMPPAFEAAHGAPAVGDLLRSQTAHWLHCYAGEGELRGGLVSHRDFFYHAALWQLRQHLAAGATGPMVFVDWVYTTYDETCRKFIEAVRDAIAACGLDPASDQFGVAFASDRSLKVTTDSGTAEARARAIADAWAREIASVTQEVA